jgi:hypothetical protein
MIVKNEKKSHHTNFLVTLTKYGGFLAVFLKLLHGNLNAGGHFRAIRCVNTVSELQRYSVVARSKLKLRVSLALAKVNG